MVVINGMARIHKPLAHPNLSRFKPYTLSIPTMSSTKLLEGTLPVSAPWKDQYRDHRNRNYQVYTTASLSPSALQQLQDDMNNAPDSLQKLCRVAPKDFHRSLHDIYAYHIRIRDERDDVHPLYFLVADSEEWKEKGVLMVYLAVYNNKEEKVIGVGRCGVDEAEVNGVCLEIAHVSWFELKESEKRSWGGDDPCANKRYFDKDPRCTVETAASTKDLEDTLPVTAPPTDRHSMEKGSKYPIYSVVPLDSAGLRRLEHDVNTLEDSTGNSFLAPQADFSGRSLRNIYDYHVKMREEDFGIHPLYFIVADQEDWINKGVLVVLLMVGTDSPEHVVGVSRCSISNADLYGANLDVGNLDWMDIKESEEQDWNGDDPYANRRYYPRDPREPRTPVEGWRYGWYSVVQKGESSL